MVATEKGLTKDALIQLIKEISAETNQEAMGQQISEEITKRHKEWTEKTEKQRAEEQKKAFKSALFGNAVDRKSAITGDAPIGYKLAQLMPFIAQGKGHQAESIAYAKAKGFDSVAKALEASSFSGGGALIPEEYSSDFIEFLYNSTAVRQLGATVLDMPEGNLNIGRQNATATANWIGESVAIAPSQGSYGQLRLSAKKLGVFVPVSNDIIRRLPSGFESLVMSDMQNVAVIAEDAKFIRGDGTSDTPKGIYNWVAASQRFDRDSTNSLATITSDLLRAMYKVEGSNINPVRPGWMFNPRIKFFLMSLRTDDGYPVFLDEMRNGTLYGAPFVATNSIPKNLGGDGDESEVYYGAFEHAVIGQTLNVMIDMSDAASYLSGSTTVHGFQADVSVLRLLHEVDFVLRHDSAFAVIEKVDWGNAFDA